MFPHCYSLMTSCLIWRSEKKQNSTLGCKQEKKTCDFNDETSICKQCCCPCIPVGNSLHFADPKAGLICSNVNMVIKSVALTFPTPSSYLGDTQNMSITPKKYCILNFINLGLTLWKCTQVMLNDLLKSFRPPEIYSWPVGHTEVRAVRSPSCVWSVQQEGWNVHSTGSTFHIQLFFFLMWAFQNKTVGKKNHPI